MIDEELSALIPDIDLLISEYERKAKEAIGKSNISKVEDIAGSLHISAVMQAETVINMMDAASLTSEELYQVHAEAITFASEEKPSEEKKMTTSKYFEIDCDPIDGEWLAPETIEKSNFKKGMIYKGKLTNPFTVNISSDPFKRLNEYWIKDLGNKESFEKCFNCDVKFKLKTTYPSIDFVWEFSKIIQAVKDAIKLIKKNLDPTSIYNMYCKFGLFIGKNKMCPANMQNLSLMLPALFMKYSIDLGNISLDLNWLLGGILKTAFTMISAFLENLRALILPFVNCYINGINATFGYIKSVVNAIADLTDDAVDAVNKVITSIHKAYAKLYDLFTETDSEKTEQEINERDRKIKETINALNKAKIKLKSFEDKVNEYENIKTELFNLNLILERKSVINWIIENEKDYITPGKESLSSDEFKKALEGYILYKASINGVQLYEGSNFILQLFILLEKYENSRIEVVGQPPTGEETKTSLEEQLKKYRSLVEESKREIENSSKKLSELNKEKSKLESKKKKLYNESLIEKISQTKTNIRAGATGRKEGSKEEANPKDFNERLKSVSNFLKTRYSVDLSNQYVSHEYSWVKTTRKGIKDFKGISNDTLDYVRDLLTFPAIKLKEFINDFFGNIINALKNLNILFSQGAALELKILGEILQLVHIYRLVKVIIKLSKEGLSGCEKIENNKENLEKLIKAIEDGDEKLKAEKTEQESLKIYTKNNKNSHLLNFKDCSDISKEIELTNSSLDSIYDELKKAMEL